MPDRLFPLLERIDLIVQTYDADLIRALMATETTPRPGATITLVGDVTVTFEGTVVRRGEPAPDALLFTIDGTAAEASEVITSWVLAHLPDESFVAIETPHKLVGRDENALQTALDEHLVANEESATHG